MAATLYTVRYNGSVNVAHPWKVKTSFYYIITRWYTQNVIPTQRRLFKRKLKSQQISVECELWKRAHSFLPEGEGLGTRLWSQLVCNLKPSVWSQAIVCDLHLLSIQHEVLLLLQVLLHDALHLLPHQATHPWRICERLDSQYNYLLIKKTLTRHARILSEHGEVHKDRSQSCTCRAS